MVIKTFRFIGSYVALFEHGWSSYEDRNGRKWSIGMLNKVLEDVLVCEADGTDIAVLGCAEWESELFNGVTRLHVRTLDKFHGKHRRVL